MVAAALKPVGRGIRSWRKRGDANHNTLYFAVKKAVSPIGPAVSVRHAGYPDMPLIQVNKRRRNRGDILHFMAGLNLPERRSAPESFTPRQPSVFFIPGSK
jgi:hypothetical protein